MSLICLGIVGYLSSVGVCFYFIKDKVDDPTNFIASLFWPLTLLYCIPYFSYLATKFIASNIKLMRVRKERYR